MLKNSNKRNKNFGINPTPRLDILLYLICTIGAAYFVYQRGQDRNWDLLNYHYYQGYALLNDRFMLDTAAAGLQTFLNPIINIFAYLSLTYLPYPLNAWSFLAIQLTSIPAIVLLAKEIGGALGYTKTIKSSILAITLCLLSPMWASELGTTFFSSSTAPFILWGVYFLYITNSDGRSSRTLTFASGVLFGLATGLKLTNAPYAVAGLLMLAVLVYGEGWRSAASKFSYFLIGCGVGFGFCAWWHWHLWVIWGNPVFPLYNALFKSEYYDFVNFRDTRWIFSSFQDFLLFVVQSSFGTNKASEVPFADIRYLVLASLVPAALLCKPATRLNRQLIAFLAFMFFGLVLWAFMFAYQRYLIPIELLLGLLIWIFVARIVERQWLHRGLMIGLTLLSAYMMKVPDWMHAPMAAGQKNPFSIKMDSKLTATPARYIVVGAPISYVLPSFHSASIFYGVGFSRQVDDLVYRKLAEPSGMPLRILAKDVDAHSLPEKLKRTGFNSIENSLDCDQFTTGIDQYIVCEVKK